MYSATAWRTTQETDTSEAWAKELSASQSAAAKLIVRRGPRRLTRAPAMVILPSALAYGDLRCLSIRMMQSASL